MSDAQTRSGGSTELALSLFASNEPLDFGIAQAIAVGVSFFLFTESACSPQEAQCAVSDFLDFFTSVFKLDFDRGRFIRAEHSGDSAVEHSGRHRVADLITLFVDCSMAFVHA
jgi:hypothetical protein